MSHESEAREDPLRSVALGLWDGGSLINVPEKENKQELQQVCAQ